MEEYDLSDKDLSLTYWQATVAFGEEAVDAVVRSLAFSREYPELAERLESGDQLEVSHTDLPGEVVYEIAGRPECLYDFHEDESGEWLYPSMRDQELLWGFPVFGARRLPRQEALLEYGAYCLFDAVDVGPGFKRKKDSGQKQSIEITEGTSDGKKVEKPSLSESMPSAVLVSKPGDRIVLDPLIAQPLDAPTPATYVEFLKSFGQIVQEYRQLYDLHLEYPPQERRNCPERTRMKLLRDLFQLWKQGYWQRLPIHLVAQCPYCGSYVLQPIDSFSFMGFYHRLDIRNLYYGRDWMSGHPPRQRCQHALLAMVSVNLNGLLPNDLPQWALRVKWGGGGREFDAAPYVMVWPLIARRTSAVVHALPIGRLDDPEPIHRYTAYFVTYFVGDESNLYTNEMWVPNDLGEPATGGVQIDTDLLKWVRAGRLYWMDPEDTSRLVKGPAEEFPYANIQPQGWYEFTEGGQVDGPRPYASVWEGKAPAHDESFSKTIEYD